MTEGYIYILFNPTHRANQFKIGRTTKKPELRAREISSGTGVLGNSRSCTKNGLLIAITPNALSTKCWARIASRQIGSSLNFR